MDAETLQVVAIIAAVVSPLVSAFAARWGSNAGVRTALRHLRGEVHEVREDVKRAHGRIDVLYERG